MCLDNNMGIRHFCAVGEQVEMELAAGNNLEFLTAAQHLHCADSLIVGFSSLVMGLYLGPNPTFALVVFHFPVMCRMTVPPLSSFSPG